MANFAVHLASGAAFGAAAAAVGRGMFGIDLAGAGSVFVLGAVGGLLPDLDHDSGKPLEFLFRIVSVLVPVLVLTALARSRPVPREWILCYFTAAYLCVHYLACPVVRKVTRHRGMMHSIPFAVLCGALAALAFQSSGDTLAWLAGVATAGGCLVHLLVDEAFAIQWKFGVIPLSGPSAGTALKFHCRSVATTLFVWALALGAVAAMRARGLF